MRRIHLSALVLTTWFAMIGWQIRLEYFQPELTRLAEAALSLAPGVNFYTLRMGDRTMDRPRLAWTPYRKDSPSRI